MAASRANSGERLVSVPALLIMLLVVGAVLYALLPRRMSLDNLWTGGDGDALSIAYLKAALRSRPGEDAIRVALARQLTSLGHVDEARKVLEAIADDSPHAARKDLLLAMIELKRMAHSTEQKDSGRSRTVLKRVADAVGRSVNPLDEKDMRTAVQLALEMGAPDIATKIIRHLAIREPQRAAEWWAEAARWSLASGLPEQASKDFHRAALASDNNETARLFSRKAVEAALAANDPQRALRLVQGFVSRWPDDGGLLRLGVRVALANGNHRSARAWNERYLTSRPNDQSALRDARDIELAQGNLSRALEYSRRVNALPTSSRKDRELHARILEWTGNPDEALAIWIRLARATHRERYEREVIRLSRMLNDIEKERESLERIASRRALMGGEVMRLARLYELEGLPEQAQEVLGGWVRTGREDREIWRERIRLAFDAGDPERMLGVIDEYEAEVGADDLSRRWRARVYWLLGRDSDAWTHLKKVSADAEAQDEMDLEIHGELAWRHGDWLLAEEIYSRIMEGSARSTPAEYQDSGVLFRRRLAYRRLIHLARRKGDLDRVAKLSIQAYEEVKDVDLLFLALRVLIEAGRWQDAERLMSRIDEKGRRSRGFDGVILAMAYRMHQEGRYAEAERMYRMILARNPDADDARLALIWIGVDSHDRQGLRKMLHDWRMIAQNDARYWPAYAAGWMVLNDPARSLQWYQRYLERRPDDVAGWLNLADVLDALGRYADARHMRLHVLRGSNMLRNRKPSEDNVDGPVARAASSGWNLLRAGVREQLLRILARMKRENDIVALWLNEERADVARGWMRERNHRQDRLPEWQKLELALLENNLSEVESLVNRGLLSSFQEARARRQLGDNSIALQHALGLIQPSSPVSERRWAAMMAAELARKSPALAAIRLERSDIGELEVDSRDLYAKLPVSTLNAGLRVSRDLLTLPNQIYDLRGRNEEVSLEFSVQWSGERDEALVSSEIATRKDRSIVRARVNWTHHIFSWQTLGLSLERNIESRASQVLRADGVMDRQRITWTANLTSRLWATAAIQRHKLKSRSMERIADGVSVDMSFGGRLMLGTNELSIRIQGGSIRNQLSGRLPLDMRVRLPAGATLEDVVPPRYSALGLGLALSRGTPMSDGPVVGGLRYRLDGWVGYVWPEARPAVSVDLSLGIRVLGSDELSFGYYFDDVLNLQQGQTSRGLKIQYQWFFGR